MFTIDTEYKAAKSFVSYQNTWLVIIAIITLPLNILFFLPLIILSLISISTVLQYRNFSFMLDARQIILKSGVFTKRQNSIPFDTVQNVNLESGILMRAFGISRVEIWTSSPEQIQIHSDRSGSHSENRPTGTIYLAHEDAGELQRYILEHKFVNRPS